MFGGIGLADGVELAARWGEVRMGVLVEVAVATAITSRLVRACWRKLSRRHYGVRVSSVEDIRYEVRVVGEMPRSVNRTSLR